MPRQRLIPASRRNQILEIIEVEGSVRVPDLGERLGVSEVTIRRDLEALEEEHLLERTHGGAIISRRMRTEPGYLAKYHINIREKNEIGASAAALIEPGETVFIHSGSTTLQMFRHLANKNLRVVTSNAGAITECQGLGVELILVGGLYREQSHSYVGPLALQTIRNFYASKCFIGVDGVSLQYGLTTPSPEEAEIARVMLENTHGKRIFLADHSKFGLVADCVTAPMAEFDLLVTDSQFDEDYRYDLEKLGIQVVTSTSW